MSLRTGSVLPDLAVVLSARERAWNNRDTALHETRADFDAKKPENGGNYGDRLRRIIFFGTKPGLILWLFKTF